jgi:hypothetical protein
MNTPRAGLIGYLIALILFVGLSCSYIHLNETPEHIDQANYLDHAASVYQKYESEGHWKALHSLAKERQQKPYYLQVFIYASYHLFGLSEDSPKYLNVLCFAFVSLFLFCFLNKRFKNGFYENLLIFSALFFTPYIFGITVDILAESYVGIFVLLSFVLFWELYFYNLPDQKRFSLSFAAKNFLLGLIVGVCFMFKQTAFMFFIPMGLVGIYLLMMNKSIWKYYLFIILGVLPLTLYFYIRNYEGMMIYAKQVNTKGFAVTYPFKEAFMTYIQLFFTPVTLVLLLGSLIYILKEKNLFSKENKVMFGSTFAGFLITLMFLSFQPNNAHRFIYPYLPLVFFITFTMLAFTLSKKGKSFVCLILALVFMINLAYEGFGLKTVLQGKKAYILKDNIPDMLTYNNGFLKQLVTEKCNFADFYLDFVNQYPKDKPLNIVFYLESNYPLVEYLRALSRMQGRNDNLKAFYHINETDEPSIFIYCKTPYLSEPVSPEVMQKYRDQSVQIYQKYKGDSYINKAEISSY